MFKKHLTFTTKGTIIANRVKEITWYILLKK